MMSGIGQDLRLAMRALRATPVATGIAILSLALAIGAAGNVFAQDTAYDPDAPTPRLENGKPNLGALSDGKGFWDPMRSSNLTHEGIIAKFGKQFLEVTMEGTKYATSLLMLPGNEEYFNVMDKNLAQVMQGNMSPEEAAKQIEAGWNKVTDDVGRQEQITIWRSGVESGAYIDKF